MEIKYFQTWDKKYLHAIRMFKETHRGKNMEIPFSLVIYRGDFIASRKISTPSPPGPLAEKALFEEILNDVGILSGFPFENHFITYTTYNLMIMLE